MLTIHDVEQRSPQWHDLRRGIVTASNVGQLLTWESPSAIDTDCPECGSLEHRPCIHKHSGAPIKTMHSERTQLAARLDPTLKVADNDTARALTAILVAERITGHTEDTPITADMWRGIEGEPHACDAYAKHTGAEVEECGFMLRELVTVNAFLGFSPDGTVDDDGLIEIKCPRAKTHLRTILADAVPAYYMAQIQAGLFVSGRQWCDYVSYSGGMPLFIKRVLPDPDWHDAIVAAVIRFEDNAKQMVADYTAATDGLPDTERIDYSDIGLVF